MSPVDRDALKMVGKILAFVLLFWSFVVLVFCISR